ncbi:hypothetical protein [Enterobacter sp. CC120223-11]|uniref:COG4705 family protein n=1 Tax=Enterobacter sp. CC120223-11 TaxID=1378073 RepID=UPI000BC9B877|nr:hypothetical protein [Enterobacter sp. CC120223-11]SNY65031.1 Uncharacterized membrane-anchored protein [Enterobacter sp. CC120223-11]
MTMQQTSPMWINKVPEITLVFWLIKMMSTTVGETAADFLNMDLHFGLANTSIVTGALLAISLFFQMRATRYQPVLYWVTVVFISVFGTLITDNLTDAWHVPLPLSSLVFSVMLLVVFIVWYRREGTLSIHSINSRSREFFYWLVILATFALGTAVGDWLAEGIDLGYYGAALFFGTWILIVAGACFIFKANRVFCFWAAYILTRPFGAACGDLLSQPVDNGGIGLGANMTSLIFGLAIMLMIAGLVVSDRRKRVVAK